MAKQPDATTKQIMKGRPQVWVDGKKAKVVPQCAGCGLVLDDCEPIKHSWEYIQLDPHEDIWGWLCPKCQAI